MLENAKQTGNMDDPLGGEDNLLDEVDQHTGKQVDIISYGEKIADILGKVKTINPNLLSSQLDSLNLSFEQATIDALSNVAKCTAIEGVEVSQEELDALREASAFGVEDAADYFGNEANPKKNSGSMIKQKIGSRVDMDGNNEAMANLSKSKTINNPNKNMNKKIE